MALEKQSQEKCSEDRGKKAPNHEGTDFMELYERRHRTLRCELRNTDRLGDRQLTFPAGGSLAKGKLLPGRVGEKLLQNKRGANGIVKGVVSGPAWA